MMLLKNFNYIEHSTFNCFLLNLNSFLNATFFFDQKILEFLDTTDTSIVTILIIRLFTAIAPLSSPQMSSRSITPCDIFELSDYILNSVSLTIFTYALFNFSSHHFYQFGSEQTYRFHDKNDYLDMPLSTLQSLFYEYAFNLLKTKEILDSIFPLALTSPIHHQSIDHISLCYKDFQRYVANKSIQSFTQCIIPPTNNTQNRRFHSSSRILPTFTERASELSNIQSKPDTAFKIDPRNFVPKQHSIQGPLPVLTALSRTPILPSPHKYTAYTLSISFKTDPIQQNYHNVLVDPFPSDDTDIDAKSLSLFMSWSSRHSMQFTTKQTIATALYIQLMMLISQLNSSNIYSSYSDVCERIYKLANSANFHYDEDNNNKYSALLTEQNSPAFRALFHSYSSPLFLLILGLSIPMLHQQKNPPFTRSNEVMPLPFIQSLITWILLNAFPPTLNKPLLNAVDQLRTLHVYAIPSWKALQLYNLRSFSRSCIQQNTENTTDPGWLNFRAHSALPFIVQMKLIDKCIKNTFPSNGFSFIRNSGPPDQIINKTVYTNTVRHNQNHTYSDDDFCLLTLFIEYSNSQSENHSFRLLG
jgi:hypothetical protein